MNNTKMTTKKMAAWTTCICFVFMGIGCGGADGPKLVPVKGTVTVGGSEPFDGGLVIFAPKSGSKALGGSGIVDATGNFVLKHTSTRAGIEPGDYDVRFSLFKLPDGSSLPDQTGDPNPKTPTELGGVQFVPFEYSTPTATKYPTTVPAGGGKFEFDIPSLAAQNPQKPAAQKRNNNRDRREN